jgi:hypothetical protein
VDGISTSLRMVQILLLLILLLQVLNSDKLQPAIWV